MTSKSKTTNGQSTDREGGAPIQRRRPAKAAFLKTHHEGNSSSVAGKQEVAHRPVGPSSSTPASQPAPSRLQRLLLANAGHALLQRQAAPEQNGADFDVAAAIDARRGLGRPLASTVQTQLEESLDADLSDVRVHTDTQADSLNQAVQAKAFTTGSDIFFSSGSYNPGSRAGLQLLAHEATHVRQQREGPVNAPNSIGNVAVSDPADAFEQEAERSADTFVQRYVDRTAPADPPEKPRRRRPGSGPPRTISRMVIQREGPDSAPAQSQDAGGQQQAAAQAEPQYLYFTATDPATVIKNRLKLAGDGLKGHEKETIFLIYSGDMYVYDGFGKLRVTAAMKRPLPIEVGIYELVGHHYYRLKSENGKVVRDPNPYAIVDPEDQKKKADEKDADSGQIQVSYLHEFMTDEGAGAFNKFFKDNFDGQMLHHSELIRPGQLGGGSGEGGGGREAPPRPEWLSSIYKAITQRVAEEKGKTPKPTNLPDKQFLWYHHEKSLWYLANVVNLDAEGKETARKSISMREGESVEELLPRVQEAVAQAIKRAADKTASRAEKQAPAWAQELKKKLQALLTAARKKEPDATDFPDRLGLKVTQPTEEPQQGADAGAAPQATDSLPVQLTLFVDVTGDDGKVQRRGGAMPWPLAKDMDPADLVKPTRTAAQALRNQTVEWTSESGKPPPPDADRQQGDRQQEGEANQMAYPASIAPKDLRPDKITVTGAENSFEMMLDYGAIHGRRDIDVVPARMQLIYYHWEIFDVTEIPDPPREKEDGWPKPLPWPQRAQYLKDDVAKRGLANVKPTVYKSGGNVTPERKVKFPTKPGDYIVYCRATPKPDRDNDHVRASSEAWFPVRTVSGAIEAISNVSAVPRRMRDLERQLQSDSLSDQERKQIEAELAKLRRQETQTLPEVTRDRLNQMNKLIADLEVVEKAMARARSQKPGADKNPVTFDLTAAQAQLYLTVVTKDIHIPTMLEQLRQQAKQLQSVLKRADLFNDRIKPGTNNVFRPEMVLISRITGQTYPLLVMLAEAPGSKEGAREYNLIDITSSQTQKVYSGESSKTGEAGHNEAVRNAIQDFAHANKYGEGTIGVRIPRRRASGFHPDVPKTFISEPGPWEIAIKWLGYAAMAAGIVALIIGTVATGGALGVAATALGLFSAVVGAGLAVHNIHERHAAHRLAFDAEMVLDIISIVGAVVAVAGVARAGLGMTRLANQPRWIQGFARTDKILFVYGAGELAGNGILMPIKLADDLKRIEDDPDLTPEQKEKMKADVIIGAIQNGLMLTVSGAQMGHAALSGKTPFHVDQYKSFVDMGWIDPKTQRWTDLAPPALREAQTQGGGIKPQPEGETPPQSQTEGETYQPPAGGQGGDGSSGGRGGDGGDGGDGTPVTTTTTPDEVAAAGRQRRGEGEAESTRTDTEAESTRTDTEPETVKSDTEPETVKSGTEPETVKSGTEPETVKSGTEPETVKSGTEPETVKSDTEPASTRTGTEAEKADSGPTVSDQATHDAVKKAGSMKKLREQVKNGELDEGAVQQARQEIIDNAARAVKKEIEAKHGVTIEMANFGSPGLGSDIDMTAVAKSAARRKLEAQKLSADEIDARLTMADLKQEIAATAEMADAMYSQLAKDGIADPDKVLDANFYTDLPVDALTKKASAGDREAIHFQDQEVVAMAEMLRDMPPKEWAAYKKEQEQMLQDAAGEFGDQVITDLKDKFARAEKLAKEVEGASLSQLRGDLAKMMASDASPRQIRDQMAKVKLKEPDAYGSDAALFDVVKHQQSAASKAREAQKLQFEGHYDPNLPADKVEAMIKAEMAASQAAIDQAARDFKPGSAAHLAHLTQAASASAGKLYGHAGGGTPSLKDVRTAAKYLLRVQQAGRAGGAPEGIMNRDVGRVLAAKFAPDADAATTAALRTWAQNSGNGSLIDKPTALRNKFVAAAKKEAVDVVGELRFMATYERQLELHGAGDGAGGFVPPGGGPPGGDPPAGGDSGGSGGSRSSRTQSEEGELPTTQPLPSEQMEPQRDASAVESDLAAAGSQERSRTEQEEPEVKAGLPWEKPQKSAAGDDVTKGQSGHPVLDSKRYEELGEPDAGSSERIRLRDKNDGKEYLFKPSAGEIPIKRAVAAGVEPGSYGPRAQAGAMVAEKLGFDAPPIGMVEYRGRPGTMQVWVPEGQTLGYYYKNDRARYNEIVSTPEYQRMRSDLDAFDYVINNLDRNAGNLKLIFDDQGKLKQLIPIDHDLTFAPGSRILVHEGWTRDFPDQYSREMYTALNRLSADRARLRQALSHMLKPDEVDGVLTRLDMVLNDIQQKIRDRGEARTFFGSADGSGRPLTAAPGEQTLEHTASGTPPALVGGQNGGGGSSSSNGDSPSSSGGRTSEDLPTTEMPTTEMPTTELPTTELPTTELPTTQLPTTQSANGAGPADAAARAYNLPSLDPTQYAHTNWLQTPVPLSGGKDVVVYRGFASHAQQRSGAPLREGDIGGVISRDPAAAHDAIYNQPGRDPQLGGAEGAGVVAIRIPAALWDALVRTHNIFERGSYPGFGRAISTTEIRVNAPEAVRAINGCAKELLPPDPRYDVRPETVLARNLRGAAAQPPAGGQEAVSTPVVTPPRGAAEATGTRPDRPAAMQPEAAGTQPDRPAAMQPEATGTQQETPQTQARRHVGRNTDRPELVDQLNESQLQTALGLHDDALRTMRTLPADEFGRMLDVIARSPAAAEELLRFNPFSSADQLAAAITAAGSRVTARNPAVYENVVGAQQIANWEFKDKVYLNEAGERVMNTEARYTNPATGEVSTGYLVRRYDARAGKLVLQEAFLDQLPRWIDGGTALVAGQGTPTSAYLTLYQMRRMQVGVGDIRTAYLSEIENVATCVQLQWLVNRYGADRTDELFLRTHSAQYPETPLVQSGHRITGAAVEGGRETTVGEMLKFYRLGLEGDRLAAFNQKYERLLNQYGMTEESTVRAGFSVTLEIQPLPEAGGSP